jgi:hypothetical protein
MHIKLDLVKSYNKVQWEFQREEILLKFGFNHEWVSWVSERFLKCMFFGPHQWVSS